MLSLYRLPRSAGNAAKMAYPRRPSLASLSKNPDKLPGSFFLPLRFGGAGAGGGAAASRAKRCALSRSVLARIAAAAVSYSAVAVLASLARCILANWAIAACLLDFSAISPSFPRINEAFGSSYQLAAPLGED